MKKVPSILLLLSLVLSAKASHILGGEITYSHISNKTYKVNVTLYRDCNDSKLNGQGGGSSNSNSSDLSEAFIRTISASCGNKNLATSISLTKIGYENITPICDINNAACGNNPTYAYGTEAHHYEGVVNFDNYKEYTGCPLHIFIHIPERSSSLTTLEVENNSSDIFYNYAYINPWLENHNSPKFITTPQIQYNVNQVAYSTSAARGEQGDSLVYKWGVPQKSHNSNLSYNSPYSSQQFIATYCNGGDCTPNPNTSPPTGLWLNAQTGDFVFTPITQNQVAIRVLEVELWRKINNTAYLASKIRRDIQTMIVSGYQNNSPSIEANTNYNVCVGTPFSLEIRTSDIPATASSAQDSVSLVFAKTLSGLNISTFTDTTLQKATLSFIPTSTQVGKHTVQVRARDNNCPKYAESFKTITITVYPKPSASMAIEDLFCGNLKTAVSPNSLAYNLSINDANNLSLYTNAISTGFTFQHSKSENLKFTLKYSDTNGCMDSVSQVIRTKGNQNVERAQLQGSTSYCENAIASNYLVHNSLPLKETVWNYASKWFLLDTFSATVGISNKLIYSYSVEKDGLKCQITDSSNLTTIPAPIISTQLPPSLCFKDIIAKNELKATPKGGDWLWNSNVINNDFSLKTTTPNMDTAVYLTYKYTDNQTGCSAKKNERIIILEAPKMSLRDQTICGDNYTYQLRNCIKLPYNHYVENITWDLPSHPGAYTTSPLPAINIPLYGTGIYTVYGTNTKPNGCIAKDTAFITVTEDLQLTWNQKNTICQSDDTLDMSDYFEVNSKGGGWYSYDNINLVNSEEIAPNNCGTAELHYVYDLNGCYDELTIPISILCKPSFIIETPDSTCLDTAAIKLSESYQWHGLSVSNKLFNPKIAGLGKHNIEATNNAGDCVYDTSVTITVLPPLSISLINTPEQLCEGDILKFDINTPSYSTTKADYCLQKDISCGSLVTYRPSPCDLAHGAIKATYTVSSRLACPIKSLDLNIPYFEKPEIVLDTASDGCTPYALQKEIQVLRGEKPSVSFNVKSNSKDLIGSGTTIFHNLDETGFYTITANITDKNGCKSKLEKPISFSVWESPKADFAMLNKPQLALSEREIILSNLTHLSAGSFKSKWYYSRDSSLTLFSKDENPIFEMPLDVGQFEIKLLVETERTCQDSASNSVTLVPDIVAFIPSAFSPDNKGPEVNSRFKVTSAHAQSINIQIFNRWGQRVFSTTNIDEAWDGTFQGQYCQSGAYLYAIKLINKSGVEYQYNGTVNLLR